MEERVFTGKSDLNGNPLYVGDIIKESLIGEIIWNGRGKIIKSVVGKIVIEESFNPDSDYDFRDQLPDDIKYKEKEFFNIRIIEKGLVEMLEDTPYNKKGDLIEISLSAYDGIFENWDGITLVSSEGEK